ncbi:MAG: universal stress protein [Pseudomonadales bacterium]|jgi:universal stress protein E
MRTLKRIVVANNGLNGLPVALAKAARLEHYTGAAIDVVSVAWDAVAEEPVSVLPEQERIQLIEALKASERQGLRALTDTLSPKVADLDTQVLWHKSASEAIVEHVERTHADLLIKPVEDHHDIADLLRTPLDWQLMRSAPCAVLISREPDWSRAACVLAAVDALDVRHARLTHAVLESSALLAEALGLPLHMVCAYPSLGQTTGALQAADDYAGIKADMRAHRERAMAHWADEVGVNCAAMHVVEGRPAVAIAALAQQLRASITVIGTAARSGIGKLVLGNTSESLMSRLPGDVVAVSAE